MKIYLYCTAENLKLVYIHNYLIKKEIIERYVDYWFIMNILKMGNYI